MPCGLIGIVWGSLYLLCGTGGTLLSVVFGEFFYELMESGTGGDAFPDVAKPGPVAIGMALANMVLYGVMVIGSIFVLKCQRSGRTWCTTTTRTTS